MTPQRQFILFQLLIIVPFIAGAIARRRIKDVESLTKKMITFNLLTIEPFVVLWSIWGLSLSANILLLPISGFLLVGAGFLLGKLFLPALKREGTDSATFVISASLANHGFTMGSFICFLLLGEEGLGLASLFLLYFNPYTFLFIFSYARAAGLKGKIDARTLRGFLFSSRNMPLYATIIAFLLHLAGIGRPGFQPPLTVLIMISIALYYFTLGCSFQISDISLAAREHWALAAIKFCILPAAAWIAVHLFPVPPKVGAVIFIESCAPAAIYSVITAILFELDARLASRLFVVNTILFIALVLPLLFILRGILL